MAFSLCDDADLGFFTTSDTSFHDGSLIHIFIGISGSAMFSILSHFPRYSHCLSLLFVSDNCFCTSTSYYCLSSSISSKMLSMLLSPVLIAAFMHVKILKWLQTTKSVIVCHLVYRFRFLIGFHLI